jgi:hypothetical protein
MLGLFHQVEHVRDTAKDIGTFCRSLNSRQSDIKKPNKLASSTIQYADLLESALHRGWCRDCLGMLVSPRPFMRIIVRLSEFCLAKAKKCCKTFYRHFERLSVL